MIRISGSTSNRRDLQSSSDDAPRGFPPRWPAHVCAPRPWQVSYQIRLLFACGWSENAYWIAGPFQTGLSDGKKIAARLNSAHVEVKRENDNLIFQSRCAARPQNRSARFTQQADFVGPFFAP